MRGACAGSHSADLPLQDATCCCRATHARLLPPLLHTRAPPPPPPPLLLLLLLPLEAEETQCAQYTRLFCCGARS
jgi:hypothetical protein